MLRQYFLDLLYITAVNHDSFLPLPYGQKCSDCKSDPHVKKVSSAYSQNTSLYSLKNNPHCSTYTLNHMAHGSIIVCGPPGSVKEASSMIVAHSARHNLLPYELFVE